MKHILSLVALMLLGSAWSQELKGTVTDAETKEPVPYASVYITSAGIETITDSIGAFSFDASLPLQFEVLIRAQMYESLVINATNGSTLTIELEPSHQDLEDVIVSAPGGGLGKESAFHIDRLDMSELNAIQSSTLGEAITNINGVQAITTGPGISMPVIRGLSGLRVLTMVNGVRTENQQWSSHHGMAINELGVGAVEVIKGPSSLLYGNDAFGGVLFLVDEPYARQNSQEIRVQSRFETVTMGTKNTAVYKLARKNLRFSAAGLYANHADFQMPDGRYLRDSRYDQIGGKFNLGISRKNWVGHVRYTYSTGRAGIPGHTHDSIPDPSSFISSV
jgi:iron complex outermembrane receptor protein